MKLNLIYLFLFITISVLPLCLSACEIPSGITSGNTQDDNTHTSNESEDGENVETGDNKTLVVFFSRAGENWQVGNVERGNTRVIVDYILEEFNFDYFEIVPETAYPEDYYEMLDVAREEQSTDARPAYIGNIQNWNDYDNVILGYPIWNGTFPNIVMSFLDDYDFTGKTIYPFSTHGGSGLGNTVSQLRIFEPSAEIGQTFTIAGNEVREDSARTQTIEWINSLELNYNTEEEMETFDNIIVEDAPQLNRTQADVLTAYMRIMQAMIDKDDAVLRWFIDENITIRHMTGVIQTREEWIQEILNGELNYYNAILSNVNIVVNGERATFSANCALDAAVYGGSRNVWNMTPTQTFFLRDGIWIRVS